MQMNLFHNIIFHFVSLLWRICISPVSPLKMDFFISHFDESQLRYYFIDFASSHHTRKMSVHFLLGPTVLMNFVFHLIHVWIHLNMMSAFIIINSCHEMGYGLPLYYILHILYIFNWDAGFWGPVKTFIQIKIEYFDS